jgi:cbb3-type cytochrome oxidase cytochrome c subunit
MVWTSNTKTLLAVAGLTLSASLLGMAGCAKGDGGSPSAPNAPNNAALIAAGKNVVAANGCVRCHSIGGQGGRMGPDLSQEGARGRTPQWIADHVKNPRTHNPRSRMPAFQNLSANDLNALGTYLASLK